ncbi:hypothetical protein [Gandjariella thermophila]|uniref:hypothetical protein n=1 Tax=Gandjariella thermophila TaxID=1931992 RepID=UPI0010F985D7|nr:hypothetical protein [Gandjariella thermophila]
MDGERGDEGQQHHRYRAGVLADAELPAGAMLEQLTGLIDKSVLGRDAGGVVARYRMLETVRQYGGERLRGRGETAALRRRHGDHYLRLAEWADRAAPGRDAVVLLDRLREPARVEVLARPRARGWHRIQPGAGHHAVGQRVGGRAAGRQRGGRHPPCWRSAGAGAPAR